MRQKLNFWIVGGDQRQCALARALHEDGHSVHTYALEQGTEPTLSSPGLEGIENAHCVILPLPALNGEKVNTPLSGQPLSTDELFSALRPGQLLCGGMLPPALLTRAEGQGLTAVDYFAREELAVANAVPGALAVWLCEKSETREGVPAPIPVYILCCGCFLTHSCSTTILLNRIYCWGKGGNYENRSISRFYRTASPTYESRAHPCALPRRTFDPNSAG